MAAQNGITQRLHRRRVAGAHIAADTGADLAPTLRPARIVLRSQESAAGDATDQAVLERTRDHPVAGWSRAYRAYWVRSVSSAVDHGK